MSRIIKFRGKRIDVDDGEWVYGSLCQAGKETYIVYDNDFYVSEHCGEEILESDRFFEVDPATVGQYTGLTDKNGKEIYEGDIVKVNLRYFDIKNEMCRVIFKDGSFGIQYGYCDDYFKSFAAWDNYEVIGNIYENPELIKEG